MFSSVLTWFIKGGPCMWPLLLCSVLSISIALERAMYYRKVISQSAFLEKYTALLNQGRGEEAASLAGKTSGFAAEVTRSLPEAELADKDMVETVVYAQADRFIRSLYAHLNFLSLIIGLSPMLGLLGTVTGMMGAFGAMGENLGNTVGITAGLAEALITTVFGLIIAIAGMCLYAWLNGRAQQAENDINQAAELAIAAWNRGRDAA